MFMMAAMARFTRQGNSTSSRNRRSCTGWFLARVLTALVGMVTVALVFNFGQVALGTHLIDSIAEAAGASFPQEYNRPLYVLVTSRIALGYGRAGSGGTRLLERFMKWRRKRLVPAPHEAASVPTRSAIASAAVMPGDSMPSRLTRPGTPCCAGPSMTKSPAGAPAGTIFGRMPVYPGCRRSSSSPG